MILDQKLPRSFAVHEEIIEITYDLMLESDFYIQPWPLERGSLDDPNAHPDPRISRAIQREGIRFD